LKSRKQPKVYGRALTVFRSFYPSGRNYLIAPHHGPAYTKRFGALEVRICEPAGIEM
jgi:hypothetical protein